MIWITIVRTFVARRPWLIKFVAIGLIGLLVAFVVKDYVDTKRDNEMLRIESQGLLEEVADIKNRVNEQQREVNRANDNYYRIESDLANRMNQIDQLRNIDIQTEDGRVQIEDSINESFRLMNLELGCITGNRTLCTE